MFRWGKSVTQLLREGVEGNDIVKVQQAIEQGVDVNADLSAGYTPIGAFVWGDGNSVRYRALHFAIRNGNLAIIKLLLDNHADVHVDTAIGNTPLHLAVYYNHHQAAELLLKAGADVNKPNANCTLPSISHAYTPLQYTVVDKDACADSMMARLLLEYGADVYAKNAKGLTVLELAKASGKDILYAYFSRVLERKRQAHVREPSEKTQRLLSNGLQSELSFNDNYLQLLAAAGLHYERYTSLYNRYKRFYQAVVDNALSGYADLPADILAEDEALATYQIEKINTASQPYEQRRILLDKQIKFITRLLQTSSEDIEKLGLKVRSISLQISPIEKLFSEPKDIEQLYTLDNAGLNAWLKSLQQEFDVIIRARTKLTQFKAFYAEVINRIEFIEKLSHYLEELDELGSKRQEYMNNLRRQQLRASVTLTGVFKPAQPAVEDESTSSSYMPNPY